MSSVLGFIKNHSAVKKKTVLLIKCHQYKYKLLQNTNSCIARIKIKLLQED